MSEMVERVAEALFAERFRNRPLYDYQDSIEKEEYRRQARAAISAMRVPTNPMAAVYHDVVDTEKWIQIMPEDIWKAMIDEALK